MKILPQCYRLFLIETKSSVRSINYCIYIYYTIRFNIVFLYWPRFQKFIPFIPNTGTVHNFLYKIKIVPYRVVATERIKWIFYKESICIAFFTFELIARFLSSPAKCIFMKQIGNMIDILARVFKKLIFFRHFLEKGVSKVF